MELFSTLSKHKNKLFFFFIGYIWVIVFPPRGLYMILSNISDIAFFIVYGLSFFITYLIFKKIVIYFKDLESNPINYIIVFLLGTFIGTFVEIVQLLVKVTFERYIL